MSVDFDRRIDRRNSDSVKWNYYDPDVLPLWVADMDFLSPPAVIAAVEARAAHGIYGYVREDTELTELIVERLRRLYGWNVSPEAIVYLPGVVSGFNLAVQTLVKPGEGVLLQTPLYPPMLALHAHAGVMQNEMQLTRTPEGRYIIDFDAFEQTITAQTRAFLLCNPHNPVGRVYSQAELERMAEICLRHQVELISDEIHCDLIFSGNRHIPIASLAPEVARHTITLMAPSKTFNVAGLECSFAVIPNEELRKRFTQSTRGLMSSANLFGLTAAHAAYRDGQDWLDELLVYLEGNRDMLVRFVQEQIPGMHVDAPEATYLAWLDCRDLNLPEDPYHFFLKQARVAMNDGQTFGPGGEGFVRLNFGCTRAVLEEALEKIRRSLA